MLHGDYAYLVVLEIENILLSPFCVGIHNIGHLTIYNMAQSFITATNKSNPDFTSQPAAHVSFSRAINETEPIRDSHKVERTVYTVQD